MLDFVRVCVVQCCCLKLFVDFFMHTESPFEFVKYLP